VSVAAGTSDAAGATGKGENAFLDRILEDLRRFSPDLVQPGLDTAVHAETEHGPPPSVAAIVRAVQRLNALLPRLIDDVSGVADANLFELRSAPTPMRATLSRRPVDYAFHDDRLVPRRFEAVVALPEPDRRSLRFLLHWVGVLDKHLSPALRRTLKQVDVARLARAGGSVYAVEDERGLRVIEGHVREAARRLDRMRATLRSAAGLALKPSQVLPRPFPRTPAWASLRRLCVHWSDGVRISLDELRGQLSGGAWSADLPYLYQRWCGVKLLEALQSTGLQLAGDAVGALYLGGRVKLTDGPVTVTLWVEPRLTRSMDQVTGFRCGRSGGEVTPDYMLVTPGPHGPDAFVLDATKTGDSEVIEHKFRYLHRIESAGTRLVAGVPVSYAPLRSWAAAPLGGTICKLESSDGSRGVIPMHPLDWSSHPVSAWARDVAGHARAWG